MTPEQRASRARSGHRAKRTGAWPIWVLLAAFCGCGNLADQESWGSLQQPLGFMPYLPYAAGETFGVSQGQFGSFSHTGNLQYAIDFNQPGLADDGKHVLSVADGAVTFRFESCTVADGYDCNGSWGNAIVIDHGGGEYSKYTHLQYDSIPDWVQVGTGVCRGLYVGRVGTTGYSTGTHLHFQFQDGGGLNDPSIDFDRFHETTGVPQEGLDYTSQNQERSDCGSCSDDCTSGERRCEGDGWQECGDHDGDPCLDWGGGQTCDPGTHCEGVDQCVPDSGAGGAGDFGGGYVGGMGSGASGALGSGGNVLSGGGLPDVGLGVDDNGIVGECTCRTAGAPRSSVPVSRWALLLLIGAGVSRRRARTS